MFRDSAEFVTRPAPEFQRVATPFWCHQELAQPSTSTASTTGSRSLAPSITKIPVRCFPDRLPPDVLVASAVPASAPSREQQAMPQFTVRLHPNFINLIHFALKFKWIRLPPAVRSSRLHRQLRHYGCDRSRILPAVHPAALLGLFRLIHRTMEKNYNRLCIYLFIR